MAGKWHSVTTSCYAENCSKSKQHIAYLCATCSSEYEINPKTENLCSNCKNCKAFTGISWTCSDHSGKKRKADYYKLIWKLAPALTVAKSNQDKDWTKKLGAKLSAIDTNL